MNKIQLNDNKGYRWHSHKGVWAKGYLFDEKDAIWSNESLPEYFATCHDKKSFHTKLVNSNGLFSVIIERNGLLMAGVDRVRMFPLFYMIQNKSLYISDNPEELKPVSSDLNSLSVAEFLATGFVTGKYLLLNGLCQIEAGQMVIAEKHNIETHWYHNMINNDDCCDATVGSREQQLAEVLEKMFVRAGKAAGNRKIAIPLSGGFDSRLIALMFKELGFKDVVCFTYGRKNNHEAVISEKVARKLGFPWFFIEYNQKTCGNYLKDEDFLNFTLFTSKYCSMPFLQDYFAIKNLREQNIIDDNSILIPGHSGDVTAGSRLFPKLHNQYDTEKMADMIFENNYGMVKPVFKDKTKLKRKIISQIENYNNENNKSSHIYQNWDLKERQAKFINNSTNVINWFGYQHYLPFWDIEFMDFFTKLDFGQKLYKNLYNDVLINKYFKTNGLLFERELHAKPIDYRLKDLKSRLKFFIPKNILRKRLNKYDWQYYGELTKDMEAELRGNNIRHIECSSSYNKMIVQWFIYHINKPGKLESSC